MISLNEERKLVLMVIVVLVMKLWTQSSWYFAGCIKALHEESNAVCHYPENVGLVAVMHNDSYCRVICGHSLHYSVILRFKLGCFLKYSV